MYAIRPVRSALFAVAVAAAGLLSLAAPASARAGDKFAAIAYSQSTGRYGYGYDFGTRYGAENKALAECGESDAEVVVWGRNAYLALAVSDNGPYGYAWGGSEDVARRIALQKCRDFNGRHARIAVAVYSGD